MLVNFHFHKDQIWNQRTGKDNWPIKIRKRRDVNLLNVLGREPAGAQAKTMATATKTSFKTCIPSRQVRLKSVSKFRKRKRQSLYCVFALHNRALSCRSPRAATTKKCTKSLMLVQSCFSDNKGRCCSLTTRFANMVLSKNENWRALNASYTLQPLKSFWL